MSTTGKKDRFDCMQGSVILGLGSNLGVREENIRQAILLIQNYGEVTHQSNLYETSSWGYESENKYINSCVELNTKMEAKELLGAMLKIELEMGRTRNPGGYSDRVIDIDVLLFGDQIENKATIQIPHPEMHNRLFVLAPMNELVPNRIHPIFKKSINELYNLCLDSTQIQKVG